MSDAVSAVAGAIAAIATAADLPDEVQVSREQRRRAWDIGQAARRMELALGRIVGPVDTKLERKALAKARGFAAELRAMGVEVDHPALNHPETTEGSA